MQESLEIVPVSTKWCSLPRGLEELWTGRLRLAFLNLYVHAVFRDFETR